MKKGKTSPLADNRAKSVHRSRKRTLAATRTESKSNLDFQLDGADLDHVADVQAALLARIHTRPVDERAVGAVEVFDVQRAVLERDQAVLAAGPDAVRRLLIIKVDINGLFVGPAHEVVAFVDGIFDVDLQTAQHDQLRLRT